MKLVFKNTRIQGNKEFWACSSRNMYKRKLFQNCIEEAVKEFEKGNTDCSILTIKKQ